MATGDDLYVKIYHGSGYTWSIGLIDRRKNEFILSPRESQTFEDHTESITLVAAKLRDEKVFNTMLLERDPKKCDLAAWSLLTFDFFIAGAEKLRFFSAPT
jgi:hypothetical protein